MRWVAVVLGLTFAALVVATLWVPARPVTACELRSGFDLIGSPGSIEYRPIWSPTWQVMWTSGMTDKGYLWATQWRIVLATHVVILLLGGGLLLCAGRSRQGGGLDTA